MAWLGFELADDVAVEDVPVEEVPVEVVRVLVGVELVGLVEVVGRVPDVVVVAGVVVPLEVPVSVDATELEAPLQTESK